MSIILLIHIKIDPSETEKAIHVWKTECSPLMIQQKGCVSEKLLRCREAMNSSPIWNGIPKLISSSIETAKPIRRSCGMLGD
jgi:hypothetical protein